MSEVVEEVKVINQVLEKVDDAHGKEELITPTEDPEVKIVEETPSKEDPPSSSGQHLTTDNDLANDSKVEKTSLEPSEIVDQDQKSVKCEPEETPVKLEEKDGVETKEQPTEEACELGSDEMEVNTASQEEIAQKYESVCEEVAKIETVGEEQNKETEDEEEEEEGGEEEEEALLDDDEQFSSAESDISKNSSVANSRSSAIDGETDEQREEGDGEEEKKEKKVDEAEDRRNPQYIPRRGVFYEHDDRTLDDEKSGDKTESEPPQKPAKKAASSDVVEKWGHDLFDETMQSPKSTQELIEVYGYDIRKEDGPPKARRSRHYGKGPNKYQRNWEDEQAYNKSSGFRGSRKPPFRNSRPKNFTNREEDFPSLNPGTDVKPVRPDSARKSKSWSGGSNKERGRSNQAAPTKSVSNDYDKSPRPKQVTFQDRNASPGQRGAGGNRFGGGEFRKSNFPPRTSTSSGTFPPVNKETSKDKFDNEDIATLAQHFSNAVINIDKKNIVPIKKGPAVPAPSNSATPTSSVPKSIVISSTAYSQPVVPSQQVQESEQRREDRSNEVNNTQLEKGEVAAKSKRYSTQRQRSTPLQQQAPLQVTSTSTAVPPQLHPPTTTSPNANYLPHPPPNFFPPPPPPTTCMEPPPQFQAPPPPPGAMVTFIPNVNPNQAYQPPPPQYIPHQFMTVPSHVAAGPPPPPPGAPPEVYQGGGITYYNTQSQIPPRQTPSRRIKLAIPIVAPDSQQSIQ